MYSPHTPRALRSRERRREAGKFARHLDPMVSDGVEAKCLGKRQEGGGRGLQYPFFGSEVTMFLGAVLRDVRMGYRRDLSQD
mmetsp:Transcript_42642/g.134266  ORF Transcript_42642/g.134266 Transcript_42642/m.134266 type:complete len:82 (-) Transcript_42642:628-873(-)